MNRHAIERIVLWGVPVGVLLVAYIGVSVQAGTPWPWLRVVHEDRVHTLIGTVFYFEHAARELIPDVVLAFAVAGAMRHFFVLGDRSDLAEIRLWRRRLLWVAGLTIAVVVGGTVWSVGVEGLSANLSQLHTRPGAPLAWGAHWRYHLVERFAQIMLAFCACGVLWMGRGRPDAHGGRGFLTALILFGATTLAFGLTSEPFRDPVFLGHQLRELFTHTLVTLPLSVGVCAELASIVSRGRPRSTAPVWPVVTAGGVAVLAGTVLLAASVATGARSRGQTSGLADLLLPHFFEHSLGYVLVPALSGLIYVWSVEWS